MSAEFQCGTLHPTPKRKGVARLCARLRCESGSAMVETSLSFMIMILMVFGLMECCMMAYTYSVLEDAAREGVRYASVHGTNSSSCSGPSSGCADSTGANVVTDVQNYATQFAGNIGTMVVTVTYPDGTSTAMSRVKVAISYSYAPLMRYPGVAQALNVSSAGRILY